jgi:hypothetical protein
VKSQEALIGRCVVLALCALVTVFIQGDSYGYPSLTAECLDHMGCEVLMAVFMKSPNISNEVFSGGLAL